MKAIITVTDDQGRKFSGTIDLVQTAAKAAPAQTSPASPPGSHRIQKADFALSCRAFATKFVAKRMSGAQRFVILTARLAKGKTETEVKIDEIMSEWKKAEGPMGGKFNSAHATRAKDNGWVDTPKQGVYVLQTDWPKAFGR